MWSDHGGDFDESDLPILAEASQRTVLPPVSCPLCPQDKRHLQLESDTHIAEHLHYFALQPLPWDNPDENSSRTDNTVASMGSRPNQGLRMVEIDDMDEG